MPATASRLRLMGSSPVPIAHERRVWKWRGVVLLGRQMLDLLDELGLPFPTVQHGTLATTSWEALTTSAAANT